MRLFLLQRPLGRASHQPNSRRKRLSCKQGKLSSHHYPSLRWLTRALSHARSAGCSRESRPLCRPCSISALSRQSPKSGRLQCHRTTKSDSVAAFTIQPGMSPPFPREGRWHLDGWVAWRSGSGLPSAASGARPASYGGTQAGAIARFDLASGAHRPAVHVRATYAPDRPRQSEIAAGAGLRPLGGLPVRVMGELRATRAEGRTEVRPAMLAVSELAPMLLPLGMTGEGYAQAGWIGGRYSTAFVDGQARVTRAMATVGPARLRIGAGVWGGAQKFAERVDVGPTVALDLATGPVGARLSLDYRVHVAGDATPGDGLALTLSTGF